MEAEEKFRGSTGHFIKDIEGCFPNMPKDKISFAIMDLSERLKKNGFEGVAVPHGKSEKCTWVRSGSRVPYKKTFIPFADLINILNFSLDNTFVKSLSGKILHQTQGIPMGDPHSP